MNHNGKSIVIIGSGIAGLCTAVYALKCGYYVQILEMHDMAGGLAMSWRRGPYTFETCLHWLIGSRPNGEFHARWHEIFNIDQLNFIDPEEFVRIETETGKSVTFYTNVDRLEVELLRHAPQDAAAIRDLTQSIRSLGKFHIVDPAGRLADNWGNIITNLPLVPQLARLLNISGSDYGRRFSDPLLRSFFSTGDIGKMSAIAMVLSLAWMNSYNAGYCIGGAQAMIRLIEEKIASLGGTIRFNAKVERILVDDDKAVGVQLATGEAIPADWVVSAADGHSTIYDLLGGKYTDKSIRRQYAEKGTFASYLQISLGIARDLSDEPPMLVRILDNPIRIDPTTETTNVPFRIFNFDPTFAPAGKTAVTCLLPTRNFSYWTELRRTDPFEYHEQKHRVAREVISVLEKRIPGIREAVEVIDVSTPATVIRYTGNWKGSQEGWLVEPGASFKLLPNTLPGLSHFMMVGQWIMPGGGLPSGPMTARPAVKAICHHDHVPFTVHPAQTPEAVTA